MFITNPDDLLAQAAAGFQSGCDAEVIAEAAELAEVEQARLRLSDRWHATTNPVNVWVVGLPVIYGTVVTAGSSLVVVASGETLWALNSTAVIGVAGLASGLRDEGPGRILPELTWSTLLRDFTGQLLRIHTIDGRIRNGELAGVGSDFFDLRESHTDPVSPMFAIGFTALVAVQTPARRDG